MEENANKCVLGNYPHSKVVCQVVNLFAMYPFKYKLLFKILSSSLNTMLIVDKHCSYVCCDDFPVPQIDRKNEVKNSDMENFICNQNGERLVNLNTENIKICGH